jgi:hypothetical protein
MRPADLEKDADCGLERATKRDQPPRLREVDTRVVRHECGTREAEAKASELLEPPALDAQLFGLLRLDSNLRLGRLHLQLIGGQASARMGRSAYLEGCGWPTRFAAQGYFLRRPM